jgi:hypothetical protein
MAVMPYFFVLQKMLKPELNEGLIGSEFANLNANQIHFRHKPDNLQEHLDGLLATLHASVPQTEKAADFVTWRGVLTKIICTPFRRSEPWDFNILRRAVQRRRSIYTDSLLQPELGHHLHRRGKGR